MSEEKASKDDVDLEAPSVPISQYQKVISVPVKRDHTGQHKMPEHNPAEVSFVLERNFGEDGGPNNSGGKMGLFSIALVMCVCCIS